MTLYGRSDITSVTISGAGHTHERGKNDANIIVSCPTCEPELLRDTATWSRDITRIPLTPDEVRSLEEDEHAIAMFQQAQVAANAREALDNARMTKTTRRGASK